MDQTASGTLSLNKEVQELQAYSISDREILDNTNNECRIIDYDEIMRASSIDDLFDNTNATVIRYVLKDQKSAHWVVMIRAVEETKYGDRPVIRYYDPYGFPPDEPSRILAQDRPYLRELLAQAANAGYIMDINDSRHQKIYDDVNTCGRHIITRVCYKYMSNYEYNKFLSSQLNINTFDRLVTLMTMLESKGRDFRQF